MNNDITVNRKILQWGWYKNSNTKDVFLHLLLAANWHDGEYMGQPILRGQCVFGLLQLSDSLGISVRCVRTALNHLKSTGELTIRTTNKYSIATIVKYSDYQLSTYLNDKQNDKQLDNQLTNERQTTDNIQISKSNKSLNTSLSEQSPDEGNSEKKKRKSPVFGHESNPYKLAACLSKMIHDNNPSAKQQGETDLQRWAYDFDLTIRIDKRTAQDVYEVMKWSQRDSFWKSNILSAGKLREKYDQLELRMRQGNSQQAPKGYDGIRKL